MNYENVYKILINLNNSAVYIILYDSIISTKYNVVMVEIMFW